MSFIALICNKKSATLPAVSLFCFMLQMYKVFLKNRAIIFTEILPKEENYFFDGSQEPNTAHFLQFLNDFLKSEHPQVFIYGKATELFTVFNSFFTVVDAAGGLVKNEKDEFLFIYRRDLWDLPKGHVEKGESIEEAALREVSEETGIPCPQLKHALPTTYHMYFEKNQWCIKRTFWFAMHCNSNIALVPQTEEDISELKWFSKEHFDEVLANTHSSIADFLSNPAVDE